MRRIHAAERLLSPPAAPACTDGHVSRGHCPAAGGRACVRGMGGRGHVAERHPVRLRAGAEAGWIAALLAAMNQAC